MLKRSKGHISRCTHQSRNTGLGAIMGVYGETGCLLGVQGGVQGGTVSPWVSLVYLSNSPVFPLGYPSNSPVFLPFKTDPAIQSSPFKTVPVIHSSPLLSAVFLSQCGTDGVSLDVRDRQCLS